MQGLIRRLLRHPRHLPTYLTSTKPGAVTTAAPEFKAAEDAVKERINKLLNVKGTKTVDSFHRELGLIMWDDCGMARTEESLMRAIERIPQLRKEFWKTCSLQAPRKASMRNWKKPAA